MCIYIYTHHIVHHDAWVGAVSGHEARHGFGWNSIVADINSSNM